MLRMALNFNHSAGLGFAACDSSCSTVTSVVRSIIMRSEPSVPMEPSSRDTLRSALLCLLCDALFIPPPIALPSLDKRPVLLDVVESVVLVLPGWYATARPSFFVGPW